MEADSHHLALVFFDVLLFDSVSLLWTPYAHRREILESIVRPISGRSTLSDRVPIDLHSQDVTCALRTLEKIFKDIVDRRQEGIVLKADEASYHDFRTQWVKLKKDYIPGYGDALDLVVVGAGWDKTRAQELRGCFFSLLFALYSHLISVAPTTLTTLYIGALTNPYPMTGNVSLSRCLGVKSNHRALDWISTQFPRLLHSLIRVEPPTIRRSKFLVEKFRPRTFQLCFNGAFIQCLALLYLFRAVVPQSPQNSYHLTSH